MPIHPLLLAAIVFLILVVLSALFSGVARVLLIVLAWVASPFQFVALLVFAGAEKAYGAAIKSVDDLPLDRFFERVALILASLCVIIGELPILLSKVGWFFNIKTTHIPLPIDVFSSLLWIFVPALLFLFLLELLKMSSRDSWLFPDMGDKVRTALVVVVIGLIVLAVADTAVFYYLSQQPISIPHFQKGASPAPLIVSAVFAMILIAAAAIALPILFRGKGGIVTLFMLACAFVGILLWVPFELVMLLIEGLGLMFARLSPKPIRVRPVQPVETLFRRTGLKLPGKFSRKKYGDDEDEEEIPEEEADMYKHILVFGFGFVGKLLASYCLDDLNVRRLNYTLLGGSIINLEQQKDAETRLDEYKHSDFSPKYDRIFEEKTQAKGDDVQAYHNLISWSIRRAQQEKVVNNCVQGEILIFAEFMLLSRMEETLREFHAHFPQFTLLPVSPMPAHRGEEVLEAYKRLEEMWHDGLFHSLFVYDRRGPYALKRGIGQELQERSVVDLVNSLCNGYLFDDGNRPLFGTLETLGMHSMCSSASFSERLVSWGREPFLYGGARKVFKSLPPRSYGDPNTVIEQGRQALKEIGKPEHRAIAADMDGDGTMMVVGAIPFRNTQRDFKYVGRTFRSDVNEDFRFADTQVVTGGSVPIRHRREELSMFVAAMFPLTKARLIEQFMLPEQAMQGSLPQPKEASNGAVASPGSPSDQQSDITAPVAEQDEVSKSNMNGGSPDSSAQRKRGQPSKPAKSDGQE